MRGSRSRRKDNRIRGKVLLIAALVLASASVATAQPDRAPSKGHPATCDGLPVTHHQHRARTLLKRAYAVERWESGPKRSLIERAQRHRRCIEVERTRRQLSAFRAQLARELATYAAHQHEIDALTPYGEWAIPEYIVECESGGSWSAYNPSGAAGPYQIMPEWGRPWPITSEADRLMHHRIAARIWNGGAGAGNWECA